MKVSIGVSYKRSNFQDMKVGQLAKAVYLGEERIVLRTFSGWVSLSDPLVTWSLSSEVDFEVEILPKGTTVTLITEV